MKTFFIFCILSLFLGGCSSPKTDVIRVAVSSFPKTLDPRYATDAIGMRLGGLLFSSLVKMEDLKIKGDLATKWEYREQSRSYWFLLRKAYFHSGEPITKQDVLFSFAEYQKKKSPFYSAFQKIKKIEVTEKEEGMEVVLFLTNPTPTLLLDLTVLKILPKKELEKWGEDFQEHIVGSGPFRLAKKAPQSLSLSYHQKHWIPVASKEVDFLLVKNDNTRFLKAIKGEVDIIQSDLSFEKVKAIEKNHSKKLKIYKAPGLSFSYLLINFKNPYLQKKEIRQALFQSIDRESIIQYKLEGFGILGSSILSPENPFFHKKVSFPSHNLSQAKSILKKYVTRLPSQVATDSPLSFTIKVSNNRNAIETSKIILDHWKRAGIKADVKSLEWGVFYSDVGKGHYDIAMMNWSGATDPDIYRVALHSNQWPPGRNRGFYKNPKVDSLLNQGIEEMDFDKRKEIYFGVQQEVAKDLAILPLWYDMQVAIVSRRIKNFSLSQNGNYDYLLKISQ